MELAAIGALGGLALVDSTSAGTLVLPVVMLLQPRVRGGRYLLYLTTIAMFYWLLGVALLLGATWLVGVASGLDDNRLVDWIQLVVGVGMLVLSFWPDTRWAKERAAVRARAVADGGRSRAEVWADRVVGPQAHAGVVMAVALAAGLVEAASMLPYLGAIGLIGSSGMGVAGQLAVLSGYVVVMCLPALVLLGLRLVVGARVDGALDRLRSWLLRFTGGAIWWIVGILGFLLAGDAIGRIWG